MSTRLFWCIGFLLWGVVSAWGKPVNIEVKSQAVVHGTQITIGDVALVEGENPGIVAKIQEIVIGQAPAAGEERSLPGEYIRTRLKQHGIQPDDFQLQVPPRISVTRASQRLDVRGLEAAVIRAITARMPWQPAQASIRDIRGIDTLRLPPGPVDYEVFLPSNADFLGIMAFTIVVRVAGRTEERLYGTAYIEVMQDVVTTTRPMARLEVIGPQDIRLMRVQIDQRQQQVITKIEDVVGKRAKRPVQANAALRPTDIENLPLVQKKDAVLILIESPGLKVTAIGEALEQGNRGETIRIKNTATAQEFRAVVVDAKTVRVPF